MIRDEGGISCGGGGARTHRGAHLFADGLALTLESALPMRQHRVLLFASACSSLALALLLPKELKEILVFIKNSKYISSRKI